MNKESQEIKQDILKAALKAGGDEAVYTFILKLENKIIELQNRVEELEKRDAITR
jgi:hypothetical protein